MGGHAIWSGTSSQWMVSLCTLWKTSQGQSWILHHKWLLLIAPEIERRAFHYGVGVQTIWARCTSFHPRWANSRREWDWGIATMSRLSCTCPASGKQDSSRVDQWEATCSPMDVGWNIHARSRVKGSKWRIVSVKEFNICLWQQRDKHQHLPTRTSTLAWHKDIPL